MAGVGHEFERLAQPGGIRTRVGNLEVVSVVNEPLASDCLAHDRHVFAGLAEWLSIGNTVPSLDDLRSGHEAEKQADAKEQ